MEEKEKREGEYLLVATAATTALWGGAVAEENSLLVSCFFEWKGGFCTAHTVSFANENRAVLNAKANVRDSPGLTH